MEGVKRTERGADEGGKEKVLALSLTLTLRLLLGGSKEGKRGGEGVAGEGGPCPERQLTVWREQSREQREGWECELSSVDHRQP